MENVLLISGSLRAGSYNTALLRAFAAALPEEATVAWADIGSLPLYNTELEANFPPAATQLRQQILAADVVIISTPEYNRAMSGALKNAIDWASRPYGENAWVGKRVLVCSVSPGSISGALANYQVKQSLMHLGATVLPREFMVGSAGSKFDEAGVLTDEKTLGYVAAAVEALGM
mgnify:CR=1 FL=1